MKIKITDSVKYIGVNDYGINLFESQYKLERGMAYNSYIIFDDKIAVMDGVDRIAEERWLTNLTFELGDKKPDYLVVHHLEPDHSASIDAFMERYPDAKIVLSQSAARMFPQFSDIPADKLIPVKENDTLTLGEHKLTFYMAPMVHWPEVMVSYDEKDKILFSADAFGKFGTVDADEDWACEARRYYFNIVGKYGRQVQTLLKKLSSLEIKFICPLHGPIISDKVGEVVELYKTWSSYEPEDRGVFIAVASIHGNTLKAAEKLKKILEDKGCTRVAMSDLSREDIAECVEDAFRHSVLVCMASSYDGGVFMPMSDFINRLEHKGFQNRKVALVENTTWAPSAIRTMKAEFEKMKNITILSNTVSIKTRLTKENEKELEALADDIMANL